ncbi:class I glutamine amidotransferase-like protein [Massariosphaeria phaeospora]|uniref:Class I glutamine amidotransferase-like protein n=1 Tax=Massariosphaeria phaeospora TaxID=100035 RepID=A0A7C8I2D7_9PLEO|nr:class I glutamine amidotransferase-like protein [Massariosphaeria phaeospora]
MFSNTLPCTYPLYPSDSASPLSIRHRIGDSSTPTRDTRSPPVYTMPPLFSVAVLVYPGADVLDFAGPLEIYSTNPPPGAPVHFTTTTFAHRSPVKAAANALTLVPDASFADVSSNLENYDVLVIPGAAPEHLIEYADSAEGIEIAVLLRRFAQLPPRKETGHRIIQSVCTGAFLLAAAGILAGRTVTTHHIGVVRKRWVDAGKTEQGVRIVNAGGVTSGLDASLWVMEMLVGRERAQWVADIIEFERRGQNEAWGS